MTPEAEAGGSFVFKASQSYKVSKTIKRKQNKNIHVKCKFKD